MASATRSFDFLVLGSGIAGLTFALKVAGQGRVAIVTKKNRADSNTNWAQGGIASVTSREDSFALHIQDTLEAGAGLCKEAAVRCIVEEGPARIAELIELGTQFTERELPSQPGRRELDLTKEGGHSRRRILHAKDATGAEIERALLAAIAANPVLGGVMTVLSVYAARQAYANWRLARENLDSLRADLPTSPMGNNALAHVLNQAYLQERPVDASPSEIQARAARGAAMVGFATVAASVLIRAISWIAWPSWAWAWPLTTSAPATAA
jgi:hypothetical protein